MKKIAFEVPPGWSEDACRAWALGQRTQAVQETLKVLNAQPTGPNATRLVLQAAYYLFLLGELPAAAGMLAHRHAADPAHEELTLNLAIVLLQLKRDAQALPLLEQLAQQHPENATVWDGLATVYQRLKRLEEAAGAGRQSLAIKHAKRKPVEVDWCLPKMSPQAFAAQAGKRNVIAFSLWGHQAPYLRGTLRNLLLMPDIYPGWVPQLHVDDSVPADFLDLARRLGAEVLMHPAGETLRQRLCWRFAVANDPSVGYFLVRDADSVISVREAMAVQQWRTSGRWFHVMRDWWSHTDLMLAGMWGGVAGVLPDLTQRLMTYRAPAAETPNIDQWFLRDCVWSYVCASVWVNDRCFADAHSHPFPGDEPGRFHVGQDEHAARGEWQAQWLAPWLEGCPSLRG